MLNSDFEKEVQHKMEELKFTPADAVWDNIEASLPQTRRRRLVFFWLLLGLLAGSGAWYFIQNFNGENNDQADVRASGKEPDKQAVTTAAQDLEKQLKGKSTGRKSATINANDSAKDVSGPTKGNKAKTIAPQVKARDASSQATGSTQTKNSVGLPGQVQEKKVIAQTSNEKKVAAETIRIDKGLVISDVLISDTRKSGNNAGAIDKTYSSTAGENTGEAIISSIRTGHLFLAKDEDHKDQTAVLNETSDNEDAVALAIKEGSTINAKGSAVKPSISKKKQLAWEFGLYAGSGISNVKNGLFENTLYASDPLNSGGSVGGGSAFKTIPNPTKGFTYSAGLYGEKAFAKKWSFYTGLQYQYASNNILVGSKVDSAISLNFSNTRLESSAFYRGGVNTNYTNHYHLLQLPVLVKYKPLARWPLYLEAGGSISYLAGSNGLQYNATRNAYISSNDAFNRCLLSGNLGAGVKLAQKSKLPLQLGYRFGYTATSLTKNAFGQQHLSNSLLYLGFRLNK
ncbi:MAG: outer membrane beta-barrel protein [Bacteroidota bacterium]